MESKRMSQLISLALLLVVAGVAAGYAQMTGRNALERTGDRVQVSQGKQMLERDQKELEAYRTKLADLDNAFANNDVENLNALSAQLAGDMTREVGQSAEKAEQAKRELKASRSEVRSDRRELAVSRDDANTGVYTDDDRNDLARDRANKFDDNVDSVRDAKDLQAIVARAEKQQQILQSVKSVKFSFADDAAAQASANAKNQFKEFASLMEQDLVQTQKEIKEDRQEVREDRRETRDDVWESDEPDNQIRRRRR